MHGKLELSRRLNKLLHEGGKHKCESVQLGRWNHLTGPDGYAAIVSTAHWWYENLAAR